MTNRKRQRDKQRSTKQYT